MHTTTAHSAALPLAHSVLRVLIVVNWLFLAAMVVLLAFMPTREWIMTSLDLAPSAETDRIVLGWQSIGFIGACTAPVNYLILTRLLAMVRSVRAGDPFVAANAARLQSIAWGLLTLQVMSVIISGVARVASSDAHPIVVNAGFSITGWLAVLLTFLLARVFAEGTLMRDDLEGTV